MSELLQAGAQKLILQAVEAELSVHLEQHADRRTEAGHAGVVRNGYQPEREIQTGIGPVTVKIPKVRAKTGEPVTFQSTLRLRPKHPKRDLTNSGVSSVNLIH